MRRGKNFVMAKRGYPNNSMNTPNPSTQAQINKVAVITVEVNSNDSKRSADVMSKDEVNHSLIKSLLSNKMMMVYPTRQ